MKTQYIFLYVFFASIFLGCSDAEDNNDETITGNVKLIFTLLNNTQPLELDTRTYTNAAGNEYTVSEFKFYLSNIKLKNNETGELFIEPESYHLVERLPNSHIYEIEIPDVPLATYKEIEFAVGVDNAQNYSLDNIGALDPSNNMAWNWNTGYKFLLLEGDFTTDDGERAGLIFHIGSDENYKKFTFDLGQEITINSNESADFYIDVDIANIFKNPTVINFNTNNVIKVDSFAQTVADNYASDAFTLKKVEN